MSVSLPLFPPIATKERTLRSVLSSGRLSEHDCSVGGLHETARFHSSCGWLRDDATADGSRATRTKNLSNWRPFAGDAGIVLTDPILFSQRKRTVDLANKNQLPAMYFFQGFAEDGGLMSYGPSDADLFRRTAGYVDRILKGAKPGDLPIEQPTRFELFINLKAARMLGVIIPESFLLRADKVIE